MKVLLDENVTKLLKKMIEEGFEALITFDGNLSKQQNFKKYPIPVIVLFAYRSYYTRLMPMISH